MHDTKRKRMEEKHAFLIIVHNNFYILNKLIQLLDDNKNDIYLHIDKKVRDYKICDTHKSKVYFINNRIDVRWGDISLIKCELQLLKEAYNNGPYQYYHIISGVDLPLKSNKYIHDFFNLNKGKEFVGFVNDKSLETQLYKVRYYHFFMRYYRGNNRYLRLILRILRNLILKFEEIFHISRNKEYTYMKGANWLSVTNNFVKYLLPWEKDILSRYRYTECADEFFIQSTLWNSPFRKNIYDINDEYKSCLRKIDRKRGCVYTWENDDFNELISSNYLFARKFDEKNTEIIDKIFNHLKGLEDHN